MPSKFLNSISTYLCQFSLSCVNCLHSRHILLHAAICTLYLYCTYCLYYRHILCMELYAPYAYTVSTDSVINSIRTRGAALTGRNYIVHLRDLAWNSLICFLSAIVANHQMCVSTASNEQTVCANESFIDRFLRCESFMDWFLLHDYVFLTVDRLLTFPTRYIFYCLLPFRFVNV